MTLTKKQRVHLRNQRKTELPGSCGNQFAPSIESLAKASINKRSTMWLEWHGYDVELVEKWSGRGKVKKDLFGFLDVLAIHKETGEMLGVQVTAGGGTAKSQTGNALARVRKIIGDPALNVAPHPKWQYVRLCAIKVEVWSWKGGNLTVFDIDDETSTVTIYNGERQLF
jgi:hypothetical protein